MQKWQAQRAKELFCNLIKPKTVNIMSIRIISIVMFMLLILLPASCAFAQQQDVSVTDKIWYRPTPMGAYLLIQSLSGNKNIIQLGYRNTTEGKFKWEKIIGQANDAVSSNEDIYVAFSDGLIYKLGKIKFQLPKLPNGLPAKTLSANNSSEILFALTKSSSNSPVTDTSSNGKITKAKSNTKPTSPWKIYKYISGNWLSVPSLPKELNSSIYPEMLLADGKLELYAIVLPGKVTRWQLETNKEKWEKICVYEISKAIEKIYPLFVTDKRIFIGISSTPTKRYIYLYHPNEPNKLKKEKGNSNIIKAKQIGPLKVNGKILSVPMKITVASEADRLVIGYLDSQTKQVKLSRWTINGKHIKKDETINPTTYSVPKQEPSILFVVLMIAVVMFAIFTRGAPNTLQAELPKNIILASYWRRAAGFVIDFFPISFIASLFWYNHFKSLQVTGDFLESIEIMQTDPQMYYMTIVVMIIYIAYCTIMEAKFGWTIGKYVLRMQVRQFKQPAETPNILQALLRNATKILELSFIPLLFVMMLTFTRQRLGDLIAKTIVVQFNSYSNDKSQFLQQEKFQQEQTQNESDNDKKSQNEK